MAGSGGPTWLILLADYSIIGSGKDSGSKNFIKAFFPVRLTPFRMVYQALCFYNPHQIVDLFNVLKRLYHIAVILFHANLCKNLQSI